MIMWLEFRSKGQNSASIFNTLTAEVKGKGNT